MNLISYSFKNRPVRVVTDENGEPWFVGKDVCELLGYADSINAIKQHCRGVVKYHPIPDSLGRMQQTRLLSEPDTLRLIVNSQLPAAQEFERWVFEDVLPSIRRTGSYSIGQQQAPALTSDACQIIESMSRTLNLAPSATLGMYQRLGAKVGHADLLPAYTVDSPDQDGTSHVTAALSDLLRSHEVQASARQVYKLMEAAGLVERLSRPSSKGNGTREFWALTEKGLAFGKNLSNPNNQREVAVHLYVDRFEALLQCLHGETLQ
ncbi:TPA: BRO-N domain-containing protein [Pseudomonas aeruginosa]|uniref:BRO-N domain-containing protein n=2 Tax=Pseudomonas aeruginosa TaxID=287 RepID=UPI0005B51676|nr:BRO family protein [Pseudomonas aeruginosa]EKU7422766.1 phage antirepressor [Pseudomonas aeruginosa]EKX9246884.1 phage antirepressor [Pseudomonas aeruginosa]KAB0769143.1 phage antirepressor [Pseudomonas aeruginosa]KAB0782840.1 phage antirepressor [Pseudomonas aeruginosa]KSE48441.1 phage antirepressor [Pseudomonas aeruginosa]